MRVGRFGGRVFIFAVFIALTSGLAYAGDAGLITLYESVDIAVKQSLRVNSAREGVRHL